MKPAVAYLRRSTDRQEQSLPDQEKAIRKYSDEHGYEIIRVYQDDAVSGTSTNGRNGFKQMLADACQPGCGFKFVLIYDVSRFSRGEVAEAWSRIYLLRQHGIEVISTSENLCGNDTDDLVYGVKQWLAWQDVKGISKRTVRGLLTSAEQGMWLGGVPPYGYDLKYESSDGRVLRKVRFLSDGRKEVYRPDGSLDRTVPPKERIEGSKKDRRRLVLSIEDRVRLVKRIAGMCKDESLGLKAIAERLNQEKISSPRGGHWSVGTVRSILRNPLYTGDMVWNRRATGKYHRVEGKQAQERPKNEFEKLKVNGKADWIVVPNTHPAIIDRETSQEIQRLLTERAREHCASGALLFGRARNSQYLLSGVMKCARCGHAYQGYSSHSRKRRKSGEKILTRYYACNGYVNKGNSVCARVLVAQKVAEEYVLSRIRARVEKLLADAGRQRLRDAIAKELQSSGPDARGEMPAIEARLKSINQNIDRLLDSITPVNNALIDKKLVELDSERKRLEEKHKELEAMPDEQVSPDEIVAEIVQGVLGFRELFEQGTLGEKKELVRAFVEKLVIDPDKGKGVLYIREFPALESVRAGNSSPVLVAGARYEPATFAACTPWGSGVWWPASTRSTLLLSLSFRESIQQAIDRGDQEERKHGGDEQASD
jgi:site-specific DNA recombinase